MNASSTKRKKSTVYARRCVTERYERAVTTPMRRLAATAAVMTLPALRATAHTGISLQRVAGQAGYAYAWSASASEVTLSRPGLAIVLRPGNRRYQINDRVAYASDAPVYESGDLLISDDVAAELRTLAGRTPVSRAMEGTRIGTVTGNVGGALTLTAHPATGRDAIVVDGTAPAALPVTITLTGTISRDIPVVTFNRVTLATDGNFHATIPVASVPRGSVVTITATSLSGVSPATTRVTVDRHLPQLDTPLDHLPKD